MKLARFSPPTAAALFLGLTIAIGPGAVDSYAASDVPLPIAHFAHMVVDAPHGHLFISGGSGTDGILVTDLDGGNPTMISGEPGVTGLALSDDGSALYAALPDQDTIAAISTDNLTEAARYGTGAATRPDSLAVAGGTLWFGYGTAGVGGIGSVDGAYTVTLRQGAGSWAAPPMLATTPTPSGVLAAAAQTGETSAFVTYQAEGGALTRQAAKALPFPDLSDLAVTADGQHLAVSSEQHPNASTQRFRTSDLTADGQFADWMHATVAVAPDGTMAAWRPRPVHVSGNGQGRLHRVQLRRSAAPGRTRPCLGTGREPGLRRCRGRLRGITDAPHHSHPGNRVGPSPRKLDHHCSRHPARPILSGRASILPSASVPEKR